MTAAFLAAVAVMSTTTEIIKQSWEQTSIVGHRGAAAYEPENSVRSFQKAIRCGVKAAECDLWMSKDGVPMVIHDRTVNRTTNERGAVADFSAVELQAMGVPTLDDILDVTQGRIVLVIEIKGGEGVVPATVDLIQSRNAVDQTILFSFNADLINQAKRLDSHLYCVWLSARTYRKGTEQELLKKIGDLGVDAVGFHYRTVHPGLTATLRRHGFPLFVWTVRPNKEVDRLKGLGVNFIITDHPTEVRERLVRN
jgi:glycerophosphoryl diester phosphodiesterase